MAVKVIDNTIQVMNMITENKKAALTAMGIKAENLILYQMRQGFGKTIRKTGALQNDVSSQLSSDSTVDVGNSLSYSVHVHEGTWKMVGRPYIKVALYGEGQGKKLRKVAEAYLKKGFE